MKKFNLLYKPINLMEFPDLKKKMLKYEKISHNNLNKFNIYNDKILDKYYKYLENNEKMNDDEVNNNEQVNKSISKDDNESSCEKDDILLPTLKFRKEKNNQDINNTFKTFSFNKSLTLLKNTFLDKNNIEKHNRRTMIGLYKNKYNLDNNNDNNISENSHKKSLILNNHYNIDNNILNYKSKISKTNIINNLNNNINNNTTNNSNNTNKTINNTNYLSKETFLNNTRSSNNSETKKTLKKNSNKYILYLKQFDNEDENSSENDEIKNNNNNKITTNNKNNLLNYTTKRNKK